MSPIFVRPVREQLEHDRLIRFLQAKYAKKRLEVGANVGDEEVAPVKLGGRTFFPDLVLSEGKRLAGLVEVESAESVNNLEAMAQWVHFSAARVPFHLYVPVTAFDAARRLCQANQASVAEIWTYRASIDGFDLMRMHHDAAAAARHAPRPAAPAKPEPRAAKPAKAGAKPAAQPASAKPAAAKPTPAKPTPAKPVPAKPVQAKPAKKAARPAAKPAARPAARSAPRKAAAKKKSKR